jgi:hypothetical protein
MLEKADLGQNCSQAARFQGVIFSLTSRYNSLKNNEVSWEAGHG